ncbi:reverse transcriptase domain-containing protein [Tanacetum coccineum]
MLGEHNIIYRPRTSVKCQILADFLIEKLDDAPPEALVIETPQEPWTLFTDGSSCVDGSGARLILTSLERTKFTYALRFQFVTSNNEEEYEALIAVLRIATRMGVRNIQVPRSKNKKADALSKMASTSFAHLSKQVLVEILKEKSIQEKEVAAVALILEAMAKVCQTTSSGLRIDIAGPFPEGPGKVKFLIVAMDYFTKWIEAKAVAAISGSQVKKFVWDNIVCRFGLPGEISNGLVERANRSLGEGIKARLGEGNKNWLKELPHVLWAHRTMIKSSNDDTPFSLTNGTEAVIPTEIRRPTYFTVVVDAMHNDEELRLNLDLLEERRERA